MANLNTNDDIIQYALFMAGEPTDGTSDFQGQMVGWLNRAYRALWVGGGEFVKDCNEPWLWLKKDPPGNLILNPMVSTGSVSVTQSSSTITFDSGLSPSMAGRFFKVDSHPDVFRVSTHTSGSATAVLDSVYTGPTGSGLSYKLMQLEYNLATDVLQLIAPMRVQYQGYHEIDGVDLASLERDYPLTYILPGVPRRFANVTTSKIRFSHWGGSDATTLVRVEYDYLQVPADLADDANQPLVPLQYRQILADALDFYLMQAKTDSRVEMYGQQLRAGIMAMQADNRARLQQMSRTMGKIIVRGDKTMRYQRVLRTSSGMIIG